MKVSIIIVNYNTSKVLRNCLDSIFKNTFDVETTESTLSKYLNLESEKGSETVRKFNDNGFDIPHLKTIS